MYKESIPTEKKNILDVLVKNKQTLPCLAEFSNAYCFLYLFFYYNLKKMCFVLNLLL